MKTLYAMAKNGKIEAIVNSAQQAHGYGRKKTPVFEIDPLDLDQFPHTFHFVHQSDDQHNKELREKIAAFYQKIGKYSPYGDVIRFSRRNDGLTYIYSIDFIARRAYHKPGLASDLVMFIRDLAGSIYFVGIIRGGNPGEGLPALVGGFQDVEQYHLQTPAQTLLHESIQEIGIKIFPGENEGKRFREEPFAEKLAVKVQLGKGKKKIVARSELVLVRTVNASKQEWVPSLKLSRVNRTTAYAMVVDLDMHLSLDDVRALFVAGDDAKEMFIAEITNAKRRIRFGITHHRRLYNEALRKLGWETLIK